MLYTGTQRLRIIGLQVRALPGANQVPEPIDWRSLRSRNSEQKCLLSVCYRIFEFYSTFFPAICGQIRAIYWQVDTRLRYNLTSTMMLTPRNAAAIARTANEGLTQDHDSALF
jgi:hypothetical protein